MTGDSALLMLGHNLLAWIQYIDGRVLLVKLLGFDTPKQKSEGTVIRNLIKDCTVMFE